MQERIYINQNNTAKLHSKKYMNIIQLLLYISNPKSIFFVLLT
jgi:hypothetical protein